MRSIKGLVLKDLLNLTHYKTTFLITLIMFSAISISQKDFSNFLSTAIIMMIGMIGLSTFSYDELAKSDKFLLTLPSNRTEIVKARYFLIIGLTLLGAILALIINFIISFVIFKQSPDVLNSLMSIVGGMFGIGLIESIQIPSIYKWGAERGRVQMFVVIAIIIAIGGAFTYLVIKNINFGIDIKLLESILKNFGILIIIILIISMYYISYKISNKIYNKKEI